MRTSTWITCALLALPAACRGPAERPDEGEMRSRERSTDPELGEPDLESRIVLEDPSLERGPTGVVLALAIRNRTEAALRFEFCVQAYSRSGIVLVDGRTAWSLLSLGPHESRSLRTGSLPESTESWRLMARRPTSR